MPPTVQPEGTLQYAFNGHNIRVVTIEDAPWFIAADVCAALGIAN